MKIILTILVLLGVVGGGGYYYVRYLRPESTSNFRTAKVERGEMLPTIGATGTIEPEEVVDIGCQDNGPITELKADWGTRVEAKQLLAQIDPANYEAVCDQAKAQLELSKANLLQAKANLKKADADLERNTELLKLHAIAQADYDGFLATDEVDKAAISVAEAGIGAAVANLKAAETNLGYTRIISPVKGVIIDRRVNEGETVVSALSASSLFLLAKDLTRIQIWASVNEADIGRIHEGQKATFTVDTFPNETFVGEVTQIRYNATMTQNVVTYTVVVTTPNKDLRLYPYMTATVNFEIERHSDVLKVPNAALRWKPRPVQIAPDIRAATLAAMNGRGDKSKSKHAGDDKSKQANDDKAAADQPASPGAAPSSPSGELASTGGTAANAKPEDWKTRAAEEHGQHHHHGKPADSSAQVNAGQKDSSAKSAKDAESPVKKLAAAEHGPPGKSVPAGQLAAKKEHFESGYLWTIDGNYVRPIKVKIIATDGTMTEVRAARSKDPQKDTWNVALQEDLPIVTGETVAVEGDESTTNPFLPKLFRGGGGGGGDSTTKPK